MRFISVLISGAAFAAAMLTSCENTSQGIGSSLIQEESEVVIHSEFSVEGYTTPCTGIKSRTIVQLLGEISAKGYGNFSSDFVCQFMPASKLITERVTVNDIDSMKLILAYSNGAYIGDSIAPMGLEVYRLNRQLPTPIFSTFNPEEYCDVNAAPLASKIYVGNVQGLNDSIQSLPYREIKVEMPKSLAQELFTLYLNEPEAYAFPDRFAKHFPGIYVRNSYGSGRVTQIQHTTMVVYYHTTSTDAEGKPIINRREGNYFAVTPEIITNNNMNFTIDPTLQARMDGGESIITAPVGNNVEIRFPIREVIDYYLDNSGSLSVVNKLSMTIPAEVVENAYGIGLPENLLMVISSKKDEFFLKNSLNDDKTSFIATYSAAEKGYVFAGMRTYFLDMLAKYNDKGGIEADDATFTLTPVTLVTESASNGYNSTTHISAVVPYCGKPTMVKLLLDKADISFQFSKQAFQ